MSTAGPGPQGYEPPPNGTPPPTRPRRSSSATAALVLAAAALVVACGAVVLAAVAVSRTNGDRAGAAAPRGGVTTPPPGTVTDTVPPTDLPASEPTSPNDTAIVVPTGDFTPAYPRQSLRIEPACSPARYVDLDEPRIGATEQTSEFRYYGCGGSSSTMEFEDAATVQLAKAPGPGATAHDCAEAIRTAPINPPVVPSDGLSLCILTSAAEANDEGIPQKMVLLTVVSVAKDDTANVLVTAWNAPH
jgi:hypothetical protein